jgi:hypothetical protein
VNITAAPQTIVFTTQPPEAALVHGSYEVSATGGASGNPVVFTSLTSSVCTVSSNTVSFVAVGSCTIAANQAGDANHDPPPQVTQSFAAVYDFVGFSQPVDNAPVLNMAKAGQTIPLVWRVLDANGVPVTTFPKDMRVAARPCS